MSTSDRLGELHPAFPDEMIERISGIAEEQRDLSFEEFANLRHVPEPELHAIGKTALNIGTFEPEADYDEREAIVYRLWHGTGVSRNAMVRAGTLHACFPDKKLIVIGEPGSPGTKGGKIPFSDMPAVFAGDLRPKVEPSVRYLSEQGVEITSEIGHSGGADQAAVATEVAADYGIAVKRGGFSETASSKKRPLPILGARFLSTARQIERYARDADSRVVDEVRTEEDSPTTVGGYMLGLMRGSNIVSARAMARGLYEERVREGLTRQPDMLATNTWTTKSELVDEDSMRGIDERLSEEFPGRYRSVVLEGHNHNYADDIYRHTAVMAYSLAP